MTVRFKILIKCLGLYFCLSSVPINAQILQDTTSLNLIRKNIGYIYNLQFNNARDIQSEISHLYPGHPVVFLLKGMMTYWENYPMLSTTPACNSFEKDMRQSILLCENNKNSTYEAECLLIDLCARGMLLMFYADNHLSMEVIPLAISTYKHLRRSFNFVSNCSDLNYFTGVYNYYIEAYPEAYPVYKPVSLLFPGGNMEIGLTQLKTAAFNSIVLKAESYFLLSYIYLNFENNYPEAIWYSKSLSELYPDNEQYRALYIRNLLLIRNYDDAERLIISSTYEKSNSYFQAQLTIFKGILQEKKYLENKLAQAYYIKGSDDISNFGAYGNDYAAYAYYGLSRISEAKGDKQSSKNYWKKAMELANFKKVFSDK
jgi:hypothetical protein